MSISWIPLLSIMLMEGPTVMGVAAFAGGALGAAMFISGASVMVIAYLLKKRKEKS
ncbi:MAG: hypothetical protein ACFFAL_01270 [Promethearchaeota archaeon]